MEMEQRFRNYSSDSMGSDRVFIEDSYYQGMLKATDHRKGRVGHLCIISGALALRCFAFHLRLNALMWKQNFQLNPEFLVSSQLTVENCFFYQWFHF